MPDSSDVSSLLGDVSIEQLIAKSPLFQALDDAGRKRLLEGGALENYAPGAVVMKEGEAGDSFFFIKTGAVEVATTRDGAKVKLA
ncbi:MAG TPA: cyclic nucleotide-binding domain-containing protein, partial [bacterium]|nr:cyclic nucleotide-binding domain-containing protein [bacterium]